MTIMSVSGVGRVGWGERLLNLTASLSSVRYVPIPFVRIYRGNLFKIDVVTFIGRLFCYLRSHFILRHN